MGSSRLLQRTVWGALLSPHPPTPQKPGRRLGTELAVPWSHHTHLLLLQVPVLHGPFLLLSGGSKANTGQGLWRNKKAERKNNPPEGPSTEGLRGEMSSDLQPSPGFAPPNNPKSLHFRSSALQPPLRLPPSPAPSQLLLRMPVTTSGATTSTRDVAALGLCCLRRSFPCLPGERRCGDAAAIASAHGG